MAEHCNHEHARIRGILESQLEMVGILSTNAGNMFLSAEDAAIFAAASDRVLELYCALARQADIDGMILWMLVPMSHWQFHMDQKARWMNPRVPACMLGEDFVGQMKRIVATCTPWNSHGGGTAVSHGEGLLEHALRACGMITPRDVVKHEGAEYNNGKN